MAMILATSGGGAFVRSPAPSNGSGMLFPEREQQPAEWPHQGHRLWASMPDAFWVYVYKVQMCRNIVCPNWTLCPYAHPGERARRRDPCRFHYVAVACPDYPLVRGMGTRATCVRGLNCVFAHGVFEQWLHPERFRTRMCDAGSWCPRKVCFFAHCAAQLRREYDVVPLARAMPLLQPYIPPLPPPQLMRPSRPRVVEVPADASSLPRLRLVEINSGDNLPGHQGASLSSATLTLNGSSSTTTISTGSISISSSRRAVQDSNEFNDDLPADLTFSSWTW